MKSTITVNIALGVSKYTYCHARGHVVRCEIEEIQFSANGVSYTAMMYDNDGSLLYNIHFPEKLDEMVIFQSKTLAENTKNTINTDQHSALQKILSGTGIDEWLQLCFTDWDAAYWYDLEGGHYLPLSNGLVFVKEGMTSLDDYNLEEHEKAAFKRLLAENGL